MKSSKKAMQSYVFVILIVSLIMTVLITSILSSFFKNDPEQCKLIEYEIKNECNEKNGVTFLIKNSGNNKIDFEVNEQISDNYRVGPLEDKNILFGTQDDVVKIIPYFTDLKGVVSRCEGKMSKINVERLLKC